MALLAFILWETLLNIIKELAADGWYQPVFQLVINHPAAEK